MTTTLRPIERRVLQLCADGIHQREIARRFRRSPAFIGRVIEFSSLAGRQHSAPHEHLRPLERRVLAWRAGGAAYSEIAPRFARSPEFIERVEAMAELKLARR